MKLEVRSANLIHDLSFNIYYFVGQATNKGLHATYLPKSMSAPE